MTVARKTIQKEREKRVLAKREKAQEVRQAKRLRAQEHRERLSVRQKEAASKHRKRLDKFTDPLKPKRPLSAFLFFATDPARRGQIKQQNPKAKITDIIKIVSEQWKQLQPAEKQPYEERAKVAKEKAGKARDAYETSIPKRPPSPFTLFMRERVPQMKGEVKSMPEIARKLGAEWHQLPSESKETFAKTFESQKEKYVKDFRKWAEKQVHSVLPSSLQEDGLTAVRDRKTPKDVLMVLNDMARAHARSKTRRASAKS